MICLGRACVVVYPLAVGYELSDCQRCLVPPRRARQPTCALVLRLAPRHSHIAELMRAARGSHARSFTHLIQYLIVGMRQRNRLLVNQIFLIQVDALGPIIKGASHEHFFSRMFPGPASARPPINKALKRRLTGSAIVDEGVHGDMYDLPPKRVTSHATMKRRGGRIMYNDGRSLGGDAQATAKPGCVRAAKDSSPGDGVA